MKRRLFSLRILLVLLVVPAAGHLAAQDDATMNETWYFGFPWQRGRGQFAAFNAVGELHVLISGGVGDRTEGSWRLGPQLALAVLTVDGEEGLYRLTPDEATLLHPMVESDTPLKFVQLIRYHAPYAVFSTDAALPASPFLLVNLDAGTIERLAGNVHLGAAGARFSADGRYLRYLSWDPDRYEGWRDGPWTLWERELATGTERAVNELPGVDVNNVSVDGYGERWLLVQVDRDTKIWTFALFYLDGSNSVMAETSTARDSDTPTITYSLVDNTLFSYDLFCETDCKLTFEPLDAGDPVQLTAPEWGFRHAPLCWADATHVVTGKEALWLLGDDGTTEPIGFWTPLSVWVQPYDHIASPDCRFVLAIDSPDESAHYMVWDTHTRLAVVEGAMETGMMIWYRAGGFLVTDGARKNYALYRYTDDTAIWLPEVDKGHYHDVLPDGTVLYLQFVEIEARAPGIYHYDPDSGTFTYLLELMYLIDALEVRE